MSLIDRFVVKLTARRWNRLIASTLCQFHEAGCISSNQLHALAHEFDPTQTGRVGRIVANGANQQLASVILAYSNGAE